MFEGGDFSPVFMQWPGLVGCSPLALRLITITFSDTVYAIYDNFKTVHFGRAEVYSSSRGSFE